MKKFSFYLAILIALTGTVFAADIDITCNPGSEGPANCEVLPSDNAPLFDESEFPHFDLKPGDEFFREILVTNNRDEECFFTLVSATPTEDTEVLPGQYFSDRLLTEIIETASVTGEMPFSTLFTTTPIYLGTLDPLSSKTFEWHVRFDKEAGNEYQLARLVFDFDWNFQCGEEPPETELFIEKSNDATTVQAPGDDVVYTILVTASSEFPVFNVYVQDLPPGGFTYRPGSWTAVSSVRGNIKGTTTTEPTYASPGEWFLGDMDPNEVVTLRYATDISNSQQPGIYPDIAWTEGTTDTDPSSARVLGNISTGVFVGTAAEIDIDDFPEVEVDTEETTIEIEEEGAVLGAAILPATGASNIWVYIVFGLMGLGVLLISTARILEGKYLNKSSKAVFFVLLLAGMSSSVSANVLVRLEKPKSPNNLSSLDLNFVALDTENRAVTVKCYKKGPSDIAFSQFGVDLITIAGGDDGICNVTPGILSGEGEYRFYVNASAEADSIDSATVIVEHDDTNPAKPKYIKKDKNGSCKYDIEFKTGNDSGDTIRAEVYRSSSKTFQANSSTRIEDIAVGSDTKVEFTDDRPTCGKTYYYAVIAFDAADNRSNIRVEEIENEEIVVVYSDGDDTTTETVEAVAVGTGTSTIPTPTETEESEQEEQETTTENETETITDEESEVLGAQEERLSFVTRLLNDLKWPIIIILALLILIYVAKKLRKNNQNNSNLPPQNT